MKILTVGWCTAGGNFNMGGSASAIGQPDQSATQLRGRNGKHATAFTDLKAI